MQRVDMDRSGVVRDFSRAASCSVEGASGRQGAGGASYRHAMPCHAMHGTI